MQLTINITDSTQILGLQRAVAKFNADRSAQVTEAEFLQLVVTERCVGYAEQHLVTRIEPLDFQMRFTAQERQAIRTAGQTNSAVADYLALLASAKVVNLTDDLTVTGVQHLEAAGLIAPGRGAQILSL